MILLIFIDNKKYITIYDPKTDSYSIETDTESGSDVDEYYINSDINTEKIDYNDKIDNNYDIKEGTKEFTEFITKNFTPVQRKAFFDVDADPMYNFYGVNVDELDEEEINKINKRKEQIFKMKQLEYEKEFEKEDKMDVEEYDRYLKNDIKQKQNAIDSINNFVEKMKGYVEKKDDNSLEATESLNKLSPSDLAEKIGLPKNLLLSESQLKLIDNMNDSYSETKQKIYLSEEIKKQKKMIEEKQIEDIKKEKLNKLKNTWNPKKYYNFGFKKPVNHKLMKEITNRIYDYTIPIKKENNIVINCDNDPKKRKKVFKRKLKKIEKEKEKERKKKEQNFEIPITDLLDKDICIILIIIVILPHHQNYKYSLNTARKKVQYLRNTKYLINTHKFYTYGILVHDYTINFTDVYLYILR